MALSTATVMRTITSVMVIPTTVVQPPPEAVTTTVIPEQTTVVSVPIDEPVTDSSLSTSSSTLASSASSNAESSSPPPSSALVSKSSEPSSALEPPASSSSPLPAQDTTSFVPLASSTAVPDPNTPVFDKLHTTTSVTDPNTPVFDKLHTTTSAFDPNTPLFDKQPLTTSVPDPNTPVFDKQPTTTSVPDLTTPVFGQPISTSSTPAVTTPLFDKQPLSSSVPAQDTSVIDNQPISSSTPAQDIATSLPPSESSQQTASEPVPQTTQQSSPETPSSVTSQSVEKAILLPTSTSSFEASSSSSSSESSSVEVSSAILSTFQTSVISTAATSAESTKSSDKTTTRDEITNPQTTYTTATLPGGAVTTIPLDPTAANDNAHPSDTDVPVVGSANSGNGDEKTPIIVGGIIGGIAALSVIVILIWFLKRKMSRRRRSTLLTPLSLAPGGTGGGSRAKYQINTASLDPTPRTTKLAAALSHYPKKLSEKMTHMPLNNESPGVNMNRGNSQFEPIATHSRHGSVDPTGDTQSERLRGWWSRAIQDASSDDLVEHNIQEKPHYAGHPYFANADDDAQRRRMSRPTSVSSWTDAAPSPNPFTDAHAVTGKGGASTYLRDLEGAGNPFADENSIAPPAMAQMAPASHIQEVQRSRPQTVNRGPSPRLMPHSGTMDTVSFYRESSIEDNSFETRRNKIHSNPFDLEIDGSHPSAVPPPLHPIPGAYYDMSRPDTARTRGDSFTSKYTSGGGWNRSTMGAVSSRWGSTVGYVPIGHVRSDSDGSVRGPPPRGQGVGQAM